MPYKGRMTRHVDRWGEHGGRPVPLHENSVLFGSFSLTESVVVGCSADAAWDLISTISRIGEFSPECIAAEWIDGASGPAVGARFEGTNCIRYGDDEVLWIRPCTITACVPGRRFAYVVGDRYDGTPATEWEFQLQPTNGGCRITQTFRHRPEGLSGIRVRADADPESARQLVADRAEDLRTGMKATLQAMRRVLEDSQSRPV
jgi:polyketide cyclase/dehydrase/lipid transport protein